MADQERPATGDVVIWDVEPDGTSSLYWVRRQDRGADTQLFEGADAWERAFAAAERLAGRGAPVWRRHKDGHFERCSRAAE